MMRMIFTTNLDRTIVPEIHNITLGGYQHIPVCAPPELKEHPGSTTPQQLFLASIGACVNIVFEMACAKGHLEIINLTSEITGDYITDEKTKRSQFTTIHIHTTITIPKNASENKVQRFFKIAFNSCPIGNCLIGSCVKLDPKLTIKHK